MSEIRLKNIAETLEGEPYKHGFLRGYLKSKCHGLKLPCLEYGDFGGNCRQLGEYGYRGFDICVTNVHGSTPEEGKEFTVGIYEKGEQEAIDMYVGEKFSFMQAARDINSLINSIEKAKNSATNGLQITSIVIDEAVNAIMLDKEVCMPKFKTWQEPVCTCGAKYTSNPSHHMPNVCDLAK